MSYLPTKKAKSITREESFYYLGNIANLDNGIEVKGDTNNVEMVEVLEICYRTDIGTEPDANTVDLLNLSWRNKKICNSSGSHESILSVPRGSDAAAIRRVEFYHPVQIYMNRNRDHRAGSEMLHFDILKGGTRNKLNTIEFFIRFRVRTLNFTGFVYEERFLPTVLNV